LLRIKRASSTAQLTTARLTAWSDLRATRARAPLRLDADTARWQALPLWQAACTMPSAQAPRPVNRPRGLFRGAPSGMSTLPARSEAVLPHLHDAERSLLGASGRFLSTRDRRCMPGEHDESECRDASRNRPELSRRNCCQTEKPSLASWGQRPKRQDGGAVKSQRAGRNSTRVHSSLTRLCLRACLVAISRCVRSSGISGGTQHLTTIASAVQLKGPLSPGSRRLPGAWSRRHGPLRRCATCRGPR
jgi:hypothetical protein